METNKNVSSGIQVFDADRLGSCLGKTAAPYLEMSGSVGKLVPPWD